LALQSFRTAFGIGRGVKAKLFPWSLIALLSLPAIVSSGAAALTGNMVQLFRHEQYFVLTSLNFVLFCAAQAPELTGGDQQYRVLSLYFSRALRRGDYVLAKVAALTVALTSVAVFPQLVLFSGRIFANPAPWSVIRSDADLIFPILLSAFLIGFLFASLSLMLAATTKRRFIATLAIILLSMITAATANILVRISDGGATRFAVFLSPNLVSEGLSAWLFGVTFQRGSAPARAMLPPYAFGIAAVAIGLAAVYVMYRRYQRIEA
jgi:ABC-2 type transport system permease protein